MTRHRFAIRRRPALLALALMGIGTALPATAQDWGRGAHREDSRTCERFGATHGRDYTQCMLAQQHRRDTAPLRAVRQERINARTAQDNLDMVRRMRCEREARRARDRGERGPWCR